MPCRCIVYGCRGNFADGPKVSCYSFPSDEKMRKKWLKTLPLKHDTISKVTKVCELHFKDSDFVKEISAYDPKSGGYISCKLDTFRLKKDAVPSRFSEYLNIDSENFKGYVKKHLLNSEIKNIPELKKEGKEDHSLEQYSTSEKNPMRKSKQGTLYPGHSWEKDEMSALIALYELEPCLYDKKDPNYYTQEARNHAYHRIQQVMVNIRPDCTIHQVKSKIQKIRIQFSNEKRLKKRLINSGDCREETYQPSLWCFRLLHFLDDHILEKPKMKSSAWLGQDETSKDFSVKDKQDEDRPVDFERIQIKQNEITKESEDEKDDQFKNSAADFKENHQRNQTERGVSDIANGNEEDSNITTNEGKAKAEFSNSVDENQEDFNGISEEDNSNKKRKRNNFISPSKKFKTEENVHVCNPDKDDIFGQYIAEEMKMLKRKPHVYARTKETIFKILSEAYFKIHSLDGV